MTGTQVAPRLAERAAALEHSPNQVDAMPFDPAQCAAPLPRAYQWVDGSAYVNHVELVRKARGAEMPATFWTDPLVYQGGSDDLLGARDDAPFGSEDWGIDLEAEIAVITDDVPMGTDAAAAGAHIKLLALVNDWSLRNLIPGELAKGFGFYQSKPATAFSPVAVTPDELGPAWRDSKVHLPLVSRINGARVRPARRRHRHDLQLRAAHRARDENAPARRGRDRRIRNGLQLRPLARLELSRGEAHARADRARRVRARHSSNSATACRSRCSTRTAAASSARSTTGSSAR